MDYFSDLMESYEKLKKRTFKLTYILEADTPKVKPEDKVSVSQDQAVDGVGAAVAFMKDNLADIQKGTNKEKKELTTPTGIKIKFYVGPGKGGTAATGLPVRPPEGEEEVTAPRSAETIGQQVIKANSGVSFGEVGIINGKDVTISPKLEAKPDQFEKFVGKFVAGAETGEEDGVARTVQQAAAIKAQQEAEAEQKRWEDLGNKADAVFLERINEETGESLYSVDPTDPNNISAGVEAIQETFKDLKKYCLSVTIKPKPKYCEFPGMFATGQGNAAWGYKLANGQAIGVEGETEQIPPGLIVKVAQNHRDFMKFLTGKAKDEDCENINKKVGMYDDKLLIFGGNQETGVVINTMNDLQIDALAAVKKRCEEVELKTLAGPVSPGGTGLNTIRSTVDEKCMVAAVALSKAQSLPAGKARDDAVSASLRDIAVYIGGKGQRLIEWSRARLDESGDAETARTFDSWSGEQVLLEQAELASTDGGRPLVRYAMMTILRHMQFAKAMDADSAGDLSTEGGSGGRSDTVLYYEDKNKAKAEAACKLLELDPEKALRRSSDGKMWELGVGQKDQKDEIGKAKLGEYNNTARRRAAIRGDFRKDAVDKKGTPIVDDQGNPVQVAAEDKKFQEGFTEWADELQFGDITTGPGKDRWEAFLGFEEQLESDIAAMGKSVRDGNTYTSNGKIKSTQPEQVCSELQTIIQGKLSYDQAKETELGQTFLGGDADFKNAATREVAAELFERQARIKMVQEAVEDDSDPVKQQAAKDWIIRNAIMTGGNYRDIVSDITSHKSNRSLVFRHNEVFRQMAEANDADIAARALGKTQDTVTFNTTGGKGSTIKISVGGVSCDLGFEGTDTTKGRETRTVCSVGLESAEQMGQYFPGIPSERVTASTLHQYMVGQMRLLETLINQTKSSQAL